MEEHFVRLGYTSMASLKGQVPKAMYEKIAAKSDGMWIDAFYVYRCAAYFAENERHEPEKLKWWNWKTETKSLLFSDAIPGIAGRMVWYM